MKQSGCQACFGPPGEKKPRASGAGQKTDAEPSAAPTPPGSADDGRGARTSRLGRRTRGRKIPTPSWSRKVRLGVFAKIPYIPSRRSVMAT